MRFMMLVKATWASRVPFAEGEVIEVRQVSRQALRDELQRKAPKA